ncbi:MAG: hypothetical protein OEZ02_10515, partial [Anaerolineae bacterium]|nr:hypothetical protein [Anaerolineae bacterium]
RTTDGGTTWADVTPPEPLPAPGESPKIATAFFMDANQAWATYAYEDFFTIPQYPIVWKTTDGGTTWQPSAYLDTRASVEFYAPQFFLFVDAQTGWLKASVGAGMSHDYSVLFRTSDGGATWTRIIDPSSSAYLQGCCKTGMVFADSQTGLVTAEQGPYVQVYILWTHDGGLTWESQNLPGPSSNPTILTDAFCSSHSPSMSSPQAVKLAVTCKQYGSGSTPTVFNFLYTSTDGGATWQTQEYPGGQVLFIGADFIWALDLDIHKSTDGGQTWTKVKTVIWKGQFSFVSQQTGWAVARNTPDIALVTTTDGAATWVELTPVIAP